jgi:uncharacterized protein YbjQ (UPF0145 family)
MNPIHVRLLVTALRNLLKLGGVSGLVVSDDLLTQIVSAAATLIGLLWSAYRDVLAQQPAPAVARLSDRAPMKKYGKTVQ